MEPFQRLIPPQPGFLQAIRDLTEANDILLVFDEVVTGFRMAYGGAQSYYGVTPDLCTLGKVIGGGFPLAAIAGRHDVMSLLDKARANDGHFVPQVGTLSGNPIAAAAGIATLKILQRPGTYEALFASGKRLMDALSDIVSEAGLVAQVVGDAPMFDLVFADGQVRNYRDTLRADATQMATLNRLLRERGIMKSDNKYYLSTAITQDDEAQTISAWRESVAAMT